MLHHASTIQPKHIRHRQRPARNIQMHKPNVCIKSLVHNGAVHARDEVLQVVDGGLAALWRVGRVVDVVWRDVGQVGGGGVLEDVELVDEVEEDGKLLAGGCGLGGTVWPLGDCSVVVWRWEREDGGKGGESESREDGEMHGCVVFSGVGG